ncbi:MAG: O-antigen ligase family protein [Eubacteriales bacterium]
MKKVYLMILISLFAAGSLYTTRNFRQYHMILVVGSTTMIYAIALMNRTIFLRLDKKTFGLFLLYTIMSIVSGLIHESNELIGGALLLLYIYISLIVFFPNMVNGKYDGKRMIAKALIMSHIPMIILPIILGDFRTISYSGMFYNPNSFGTVVATLAIVPLSKLVFELDRYYSRKKINRKDFINNIFLFFIMVILVLFSSSRTSFLSLVLLIILSLAMLSKKIFRNNKVNIRAFRKAFISMLLMLLLFIVLYNFTSFGKVLQESVIDKFMMKSDVLLDGRSNVWLLTINDMQPFGHGRDYFGQIGLGAHNTFISILGQYGFIPLFFFLGFFFHVFIQSMQYAGQENEYIYKYLPLLAISSFIILSMGEGMMLKTSMFVPFVCIGFLRRQDNSRVCNKDF